MKNITFSAQEEAIERARKVAAQNHRTLNELFREWLDDMNRHVHSEDIAKKLNALWKQTNYLKVGKKLSRDDMNKR
jgi:hypothetical protein